MSWTDTYERQARWRDHVRERARRASAGLPQGTGLMSAAPTPAPAPALEPYDYGRPLGPVDHTSDTVARILRHQASGLGGLFAIHGRPDLGQPQWRAIVELAGDDRATLVAVMRRVRKQLRRVDRRAVGALGRARRAGQVLDELVREYRCTWLWRTHTATCRLDIFEVARLRLGVAARPSDHFDIDTATDTEAALAAS